MFLFALAQAAAAVAPAAVAPPAATPAAAQDGVTAYGPEFFAAMRPANALEMVQRLPGFSLDVGDSVRGYEGAAGNVLVDGQRPTSKTDSLDEYLRRIPAAAVARIDVIRGGAPGIDMQGKSVLANVVRKDGGAFHGLFALADNLVYDGRNELAMRLEGSGKIGPHAWEGAFFAGRGHDDGSGDGPLSRRDPAGAQLIAGNIHSQGGSTSLIGTGAVESPLAGGKLRLNGRISWNRYHYDEADFIQVPNVHEEHERDLDTSLSTEFGARYQRALGPRTNIELVGLRQDKDEPTPAVFTAPGDAEDFQLHSRTAETIARGVVRFQQSPTLSWEAGAEGADNTLTSHTRFTQNGAVVPLPAANVRVEEKRGEAFAKGVWRPFSTLTLEASLRQEGSQITSSGDVALEKTLYFTKPRALLTWAPSKDTQVRFSFERSVGQLDFGAFVASQSLSAGVVTAGNPNLEPETAWVSELALEQHFWGQGAVVATVRHSQISDVVDRAPIFLAGGGAFDAPANIGDGTKDEFILNLTAPLDRLRLKGAQLRFTGTWRRSEVTDPTTGETRGITRLRPFEWEGHFIQDLPALKMSYGVDVCCARTETTYRFDEIDVRTLNNFVSPFWEWKPRPDLAFRAELDYAFHFSYRRTLYEYAGPRDVAPLSYIEHRDPQFGKVFYLRVRKTFGG
ncbi:TonB-dependent receptor plug domain-containing protein [Phenylobacterium sp.]|uniref:TonB-dependent receptor plug domain-containing protein n=1 Tax=Phenylobacterium sp. TaxID=1871053 RepID=UPI0035676826